MREIARRKSYVHPDLDPAAEMKLYADAQARTKETGELWEIDHIIPLIVGGSHHHLNLQILPCSINRSKSADPFWERSGYKSWRDVPQYLWPDKLKPAYQALL